MQNNSLEFVNNLYTLCANPESYQYIAGIAGIGVNKQPLDQNIAQKAASELSKFLPQKQPDQTASFGVMSLNSIPPPAIGGYQMNTPSFNPGGIPGTVASSSAKNFYTEADFRQLINSGKVVCHRTIGGNSARKGSYCCSEVKSVDHSKPMDQQCCNTHNRASKSKTSMNTNGIASAFNNLSNTQFAVPLGMNQGGMGMMNQSTNTGIPGLSIPSNNQQSWNQQGIQNQFNQPQQGIQPLNQQGMQNQFNQPQSNNSVGLVTQQNPMGYQHVQIPSLSGLSQNNQTPNQQMNNTSYLSQTPNQQSSNPFIIPSNSNSGLIPPPNVSLSPVFQQQQQPFSLNLTGSSLQTPQIPNLQMQPNQFSNQSAGQQISSSSYGGNLPNINLNDNHLTTSVTLPSINLSNPMNLQNSQQSSSQQFSILSSNDSINSTISGLSALSLGNSQVNQQSSQLNTGEFFMRKFGNEEYYFNTDPIVTGLIFENTLNGMVCIGNVKTSVKNDGSELPNTFKSIIGTSFTIDHENWLKMKGIQKKDIELVRESTEQISDEYLPEDS